MSLPDYRIHEDFSHIPLCFWTYLFPKTILYDISKTLGSISSLLKCISTPKRLCPKG